MGCDGWVFHLLLDKLIFAALSLSSNTNADLSLPTDLDSNKPNLQSNIEWKLMK